MEMAPLGALFLPSKHKRVNGGQNLLSLIIQIVINHLEGQWAPGLSCPILVSAVSDTCLLTPRCRCTEPKLWLLLKPKKTIPESQPLPLTAALAGERNQADTGIVRRRSQLAQEDKRD